MLSLLSLRYPLELTPKIRARPEQTPICDHKILEFFKWREMLWRGGAGILLASLSKAATLTESDKDERSRLLV